MGKYVYVIRKGQYMSTKDQYEFYGSEIFSSHKKAREYIDWVINVNKGYSREKDYHYNCAIPDDGNKNMKRGQMTDGVTGPICTSTEPAAKNPK